MTKKIIVAGQKGGSGKSTIARALAVGLAQRKKKVILADLDYGQRTSSDWAAQRDDNQLKPSIQVAVVDVERQGFHVPGADLADFVIYDCPGWSDVHTRGAAGFGDLMVLPTSASHDDLRPVIRLCYELADDHVDMSRVIVTLFRVHTEAEARAAREYVKRADIEINVAEGEIMSAASATQGHARGLSVIEAGGEKQVQPAKALISCLIKSVDGVPERTGTVDWESMDWSVIG